MTLKPPSNPKNLELKTRLRAETLAWLRGLRPEEIEERSAKIRSNLISLILRLFPDPSVIAYYAPLPGEARLLELRSSLAPLGWRSALPRIAPDRRMQMALWEGSEASLVRGPFGTRHPSLEAPLIDPEQLGALVIPGLLFGDRGQRLGRGAGFYDKFVSRLASPGVLIGACFEEQIRDDLPMDEWDLKVHHIVSDRRAVSV